MSNKQNKLQNRPPSMMRKGELAFSQMATIAIALLLIIAVVIGILPQITKKGKVVENITITTTGDMDGDGIPNGLDRCCPEQCKVDKSELLPVAPSNEKYGCAPWQQPVSCGDTVINCDVPSSTT